MKEYEISRDQQDLIKQYMDKVFNERERILSRALGGRENAERLAKGKRLHAATYGYSGRTDYLVDGYLVMTEYFDKKEMRHKFTVFKWLAGDDGVEQ